MPSIIEGYNYDIFISYRQKDNKHDGWVTEFVDNLKGELESTFKEEISVYFDINPHDGLLETHDVDASLKDKLKCLIFIPIISRTYCDPKSFAWEHEFKAFVEQASQDQFGLKVKLPNGNVANRVLPVQIHELDAEDRKIIENELGGFLRGIEFIYKEPGVNRPLMANEDHPDNNLNKTFFRNQINKVANAVKEIITAMKKHNQPFGDITKDAVNAIPEKPKNLKTKFVIVFGIIFVLIILGYFLIPTLSRPKKQLEKSIAVLPFVNDSPNQENTYFINGIMEEVLNNLQKIKDFRVLSRTSTDQYKGSIKPSLPKIAKDLGVNYIVEGSGQKYGNKFILRVQLLAAEKEKHLWGESFEQEINETSDIINMQSQIAQSIAEELKATITPEEKQQIEKIPTKNLTAYDLCLRGGDELQKYWDDNRNNNQALRRAVGLYKKALEYDSTYASAYSGLAGIYLAEHLDDSYFSKNYLDSVLILANRALSFDNHLTDAYFQKADYYSYRGETDQAINEWDKVIKYDINGSEGYYHKGTKVYLLGGNYSDYVKGIEFLHKAIKVGYGSHQPEVLRSLGDGYGYFAGFPEKAKEYYQEAFTLDSDTSLYFTKLAWLEINIGDKEKVNDLVNKNNTRDSNKLDHIGLMAFTHYLMGQNKESLFYLKKIVNKLDALGPFSFSSVQSIGYVYWMNGYRKEADYWFNKQRRICEEAIKLGRMYSSGGGAYYDLAAVYAFLGEKQKAYENLREFAKIHICPLGMVTSIKTDPFFNSIRNEPEFLKIVSELEAKYQAEHERVRKWLEENKML